MTQNTKYNLKKLLSMMVLATIGFACMDMYRVVYVEGAGFFSLTFVAQVIAIVAFTSAGRLLHKEPIWRPEFK